MQAIFFVVALVVLAGFGHSQELPRPGQCGLSTTRPRADFRIINGEAAIPHSRPYQVLLVGLFPNGTTKHYCGGSLVTERHVLTAAHCVAGVPAENLRLFLGVHDFTLELLTSGSGIAGQRYITHDKYNDKTLSHDIAVILLQRRAVVDNDKVGLVCLATPSTPACAVGHPVVASGWGSMSGDPNRPPSSRPTQLQQVALICVDDSDAGCKKLGWTGFLGVPLFADKSKMCAYGDSKGVCFGDSGGPLVRQLTLSDGTPYFEQVGIMSGTIDCSFTKPHPDIYANVRELHPWIVKQISALS